MIVAPLIMAVGLWMLTGLPAERGTYFGNIFWPMMVIGLGMGALFVSATIAATNGVPEGESGLASGLINTSGQIGGALGLAILTAVSASRTKDFIAQHAASAAILQTPKQLFAAQATVFGFHWAFIVGGGMAVLASVVALFGFKEVKSGDTPQA